MKLFNYFHYLVMICIHFLNNNKKKLCCHNFDKKKQEIDQEMFRTTEMTITSNTKYEMTIQRKMFITKNDQEMFITSNTNTKYEMTI
jgi:hypothetical protein